MSLPSAIFFNEIRFIRFVLHAFLQLNTTLRNMYSFVSATFNVKVATSQLDGLKSLV